MVSGTGRGAAEAGGAGEEKEEAGTGKTPVWQNLVHNRLRKCSCLRYREQKLTVKKRKMKHGGT